MKKNTSNIDALKIHTLTTQLAHVDYMAYRAAIKQTGLTSAAFLRTLVTIGLAECQKIATEGNRKKTLLAQLETVTRQLEAMNVPVMKISPAEPTPEPRLTNADVVKEYFSRGHRATVKEFQAYASLAKGKSVSYDCAAQMLLEAMRNKWLRRVARGVYAKVKA